MSVYMWLDEDFCGELQFKGRSDASTLIDVPMPFLLASEPAKIVEVGEEEEKEKEKKAGDAEKKKEFKRVKGACQLFLVFCVAIGSSMLYV